MTPLRWAVLAASAAAAGLAVFTARTRACSGGSSISWPRHSPSRALRARPAAAMSKFFKALEQAKRDRALRQGDAQPEPSPASRQPGRRWKPRRSSSSTIRRRRPRQIPPTAWTSISSASSTPAAFEAEQYRALRHIIEQLHKTARASGRRGVEPRRGRRQDASPPINLAGALAQAPEARVLLIDADLRRPALGRAPRPRRHGRRGPRRARSSIPASRSSRSPSRVRRSTCRSSARGRRRRAPTRCSSLRGSASCSRRPAASTTTSSSTRRPCAPSRTAASSRRWVDGFLLVVAAHRTPRRLVEEALDHPRPGKSSASSSTRTTARSRATTRATTGATTRLGQPPANGGPRAALASGQSRVGELPPAHVDAPRGRRQRRSRGGAAVSFALVEGPALFAAVAATIVLWGHPLLLDWLDVATVLAQAAAVSSAASWPSTTTISTTSGSSGASAGSPRACSSPSASP